MNCLERSAYRGRPEIVPLLHHDGFEMIYVTASTPIYVHDVRDHSFDAQHDSPGLATPQR